MEKISSFHRVNGLRLLVHRFRDPSAPPSGLTVLLLHGYMDAGATWDLVASHLAPAGHDVVAPDLRGFGGSDAVGAGGYYHFPDYVADLAELIEALAPRRLSLVGHSMGGTIAALYAGALPNKVERLALLEGLGPVAHDPTFAVDRVRAWIKDLTRIERAPRKLTSLQEAVERLAYRHPNVPRDLLKTRAALLTKLDDAGQLVWAYDPLHRTTSPTPFAIDAFKAFLKVATMPTLVVSGGEKGWHPEGEAERVACLPNAKEQVIEGAGHMMHWTEPARVARALVEFFALSSPARSEAAKEAPGKTEKVAPTLRGAEPAIDKAPPGKKP